MRAEEDDSTASGALPGKIQAFVRGREVFVWRAEDVILLRQHWRVVGGAIGALPLQPRQNACLGLPLLLSPEEATLLFKEERFVSCMVRCLLPLVSPTVTGVLELREYSPLALKTRAEQEHFQQLRTEDFQRQLVAYQEKRERVRRQFSQPKRGCGPKRERPSVDGDSGEGEDGAQQDNVSAKKARLHGETELEKEGQACGYVFASGGNSIELRPVPDLSDHEAAQMMSVDQQHKEAGGDSLVRPSQNIGSFSPLVCIHLADPRVGLCPPCFTPAKWAFPQTELQSLNYRVFRDLWGQGYHLTSGLKYGGDFLVYPGDPSLVHSHYVAIVLPWQQPIRDLVALGRLGAKVKKNLLLCSVDPQGAVEYFTLHWAGF